MAAKRTNRVEVEITASDEATPTIDRLERKIDGLEADEARITVSANTDRLTTQLDRARAKLEGLEGDEATVQARLVGNLEGDLEQAQALLRQLDGKTGTVRINAVDSASDDLERVDDKLRELDGKVGRVGTTARTAVGVAGGIGVAGITSALFGSVENAIALSQEIQRVAAATGASTEDANRLVAVWKLNGQEVADLEDLLGNLNSVIAGQPELAEQLGIADATDGVDQFLQTAAGLEQIADPLERGRVAAQLFGEEGVRQVRAIETAGGSLDDQFKTISDRQLLTDDDMERLDQANEEIKEFKGHWQELSVFLATNILPLLNEIAGWYSSGGPIARAGAAVADAGGATRRFIEDTLEPFTGPLRGTTRLSEQGVIARNTGGYSGGAVAGYDDQGNWIGTGRTNVTIVNPPGTPPATVDLSRLYDERNGSRS